MNSDSEDHSSDVDLSDGEDELMCLTYLAAATTMFTSFMTYGVAMAALMQQQQDAATVAEQAELNRKRKSREVRALSAYNAFMKSGIDDLKVDGKLPAAALTLAAEKWRSIPDNVKEAWQQEADRLNEERRAQALEEPESESEDEKTKAKKLRKKEAPKRPRSSFLAFQAERMPSLRASHPETKQRDLMVLLGEEWRKLSEKQRAVCFCVLFYRCLHLLIIVNLFFDHQQFRLCYLFFLSHLFTFLLTLEI